MDPDCLSYTLASFSVVIGVVTCLVYGWSRGAYGYLFSNRIPVATTHPHHPPTAHLPLISITPDITAVPLKASQNQVGQIISDDQVEAKKDALISVQAPCFYY